MPSFATTRRNSRVAVRKGLPADASDDLNGDGTAGKGRKIAAIHA